TSFPAVTGFLWDKEVEIVRSEWSSVVVIVRHVEYMGVGDNGTLDCSVPGFTKYRWTIINKATKQGYTESYVMGTGEEKIAASQSQIKIGDGGFPLVNDLMVVSCEALVGLNPRMQIIWAITRLHSPLGYPTDPRVCNYGGKSFETNCTWYQWTYKRGCYYDKGLEYTGSVNHARHLKCKYWHMSTGMNNESHVIARLMGIFQKGGHDYCRNIPVNPTCYLKKREIDSCKAEALSQPWCFSDDHPDEKPYSIHYCNIPECSSCVYGNGGGKFKVYPHRKFPVYLGRSIKTTRKVNGNPVLCMQGTGWQDNVCRTNLTIQTKWMDDPHVITKATPHCYVAKPGVDASKVKEVPHKKLELAECKFRQCTVRQVWFLFFNTYGKPFVMESNFKGVKIELVAGRKEEQIKFAAFGIHQVSGLSLGSRDYRVSNYLGSFSLQTRQPPEKMSVLTIRNVKKQYSGQYFLEYKFIEADPSIEEAIYKVNFQIDVKQPSSFSLNPTVLKVCVKGDGKISAKVNGHFAILEDTITWKYGLSRKNIKTKIVPQITRFELSADAKSLSVKRVTEELWVHVEGRSYSGMASAIAQVSLKDQPFLKPVSPLVQYALPGDDVTLIIESNQLQRVTWVFDAMVIASLPDDPNMGFRRTPRGDNVVTSLVVSDVREHHYGNYHVEAILDGCKNRIVFEVKHSSENPEFENLQTPTKPALPIVFNRTGLWCTDELDPYAFHFDIDFDSVMTIGAFRNEPLTDSKAVEVQHYSIEHSVDKVTWARYILKENNSRIPYTLLGNKVHWLSVPLTARFLRVYPERLDSIACMKVRFFGCKVKSLYCDDMNRIKESSQFPLGFLIGIPAALFAGALIIGIVLYKRKHSVEEERRTKSAKRKRKHKALRDGEDSKKRRSKEKRERRRNEAEKDEHPKKKRRRKFSSSEETSFELDSEEEREIRRKAKLKAKKKEIEWEEKLRLKRKIARKRKNKSRERKDTNSDKKSDRKQTQRTEREDKGGKKHRRKDKKKGDFESPSSRGKKAHRSRRSKRDATIESTHNQVISGLEHGEELQAISHSIQSGMANTVQPFTNLRLLVVFFTGYTTCLLSIAASGIIAFIDEVEWKLFGVALQSLSFGIGEVTFVALISKFSHVRSGLSAFSGGAGVGAMTTWFCVTPSITLDILGSTALLYLVCYYVIKKTSNQNEAGGYVRLENSDTEGVEQEKSTQQSKLSTKDK
ncbi:hypothetical protein QZH41_010102, partial [Actinostola sp. cb2023]